MANTFYRGAISVGATKILALAVTFATTLITIRVITSLYDGDAYGAVSLVATLVALIPFADLGLGLMLVNLTVHGTEIRSFARLRLTISVVFWTLVGVAALILVTTIVVALLGLWPTLLGAPSLILGDPNAYMPWYGALTFVWIISGPGLRLLVGHQRANTLVVLQTLGPVLAVIATILSALIGAPLLAYAFYPIAGTIVASAVAWIISIRLLRGRFRSLVWIGRIRRDRFLSIVKLGSSGIWFTVGGLLLFAVDRILLAHIDGGAYLAVYVVSVPLFTAVQSTLGSIGTYLWPHYSRLRVRGELTSRRFYRDVASFVALGLFVGLTVVLIFPVFTGLTGVHVDNPLIPISMGAMAALQATTLPFSSLLTTDRLMQLQGIALFVALFVKVVVMFLLVPILGAPGTFLATALAVALIQLPTLVWLSRRAPWKDGRASA